MNKVSVAFCLWRTWRWPAGSSCPVLCPPFYWELLLRKIMKMFTLQQCLHDPLSDSRHSSPHPASLPFRAMLLWNARLTHLAGVHSTMYVLAGKWCLLRWCHDCEKEPVSELSWKANLQLLPFQSSLCFLPGESHLYIYFLTFCCFHPSDLVTLLWSCLPRDDQTFPFMLVTQKGLCFGIWTRVVSG